MGLITITLMLALAYGAMGTLVPEVVHVSVGLVAFHLGLAVLFIVCEALSKSFGNGRTR